MGPRTRVHAVLVVCALWALLAGAATAQASPGANAPTAATGSVATASDQDAPGVDVTGRQAGEVIDRPGRAYRNSTCRMRFDRLTDFETFRSLTACDNGVTLSRRATKSSVPNSWATWSRPPFSESRRPSVAVFPRDNIRFTFDEAVRVAGFEVEPNTFAAALVTVRFLDRNGEVLRTIRRDVEGDSGARLFAFSTRRPIIASMSVQVEDNAGFAVAQIRVGG